MRNLATCYSQHAIKVSDAYCSGPSNQTQISQNPNPSIQNSIISVYKPNLSSRKQLFIKLIWSNLRKGQGFTIGITDTPSSSSSSFGFDTNCCRVRRPKGAKSFESHNSRIELFWDLSAAKFEAGPEPVNGYYLLVSIDSEIALILGAIDAELEELEIKKILTDSPKAKFLLVSRCEYFAGNGMCSTKARFSENGEFHEIAIKCSGENRGVRNKWEVSVWIDKKSVVHVKRLEWNFRGNQTVFVDGLLVDLMWDLHGWLFNSESVYGVFMFRTRSGFDSRLWLEEEKKKVEDRVGFSLLICASKNPD